MSGPFCCFSSCLWDSSTLSHIVSVHQFSSLYKILLREYTTIYLSLPFLTLAFDKFRLLASIIVAAKNILIHVFSWKCLLISVGYIFRSRIFESQVMYIFSLIDTTKEFPNDCTNFYPHSSIWKFRLLHILVNN